MFDAIKNYIFKKFFPKEYNIIEQINKIKPNKDKIYIFKVRDYMIELVGRYDECQKKFYVERADGRRYDFELYRVTFIKELKNV